MDTSISNFAAYWNTRFLGVAMNDWLNHLHKENEKGIKLAFKLPHQISFISFTQISQIVDHWCQVLRQPSYVHQRTIDIYELFMIKYSMNLYQNVNAEAQSLSDKRSKWQSIYASIKHQVLLRLVSCLQIASKTELNYKSVTLDQAVSLLSSAKRPFDRSTILKSEMKILSTLAYRVNFPLTIDYVETIVCHLIFTSQKKNSDDRRFLSLVENLHEASKLLLQLVYQDKCDFFRRISSFVRGSVRPTAESRDHIHRLKNDKMLLAAAIISAAGFIVAPQLQIYLMEKIHTSIQVDIEDVGMVAAIVVNLLERAN